MSKYINNKKSYSKYGQIKDIESDDIRNSKLSKIQADKKKKKVVLSKKAKSISDEALMKLNYPRKKAVIADVEMNVVNGKAELFSYFNIKKFLEWAKLGFIAKNEKIIILLDKVFYNNDFFDGLAHKHVKKVNDYNRLSAREQYSIDNNFKMIKYGILGSIGTVIALTLVLYTIPAYQQNGAQTALLNGNYEKAHNYYKNSDENYATLAEAFILVDKDELIEAENAMEVVKKNSSSLTLIDFQKVYVSFTHKLAQKYIAESDYANASRVYENINYTNQHSSDYNEATYIAAKNFFQNEDYLEALVSIQKIIGYKDSKDIQSSMAEALYEQANTLFNARQFNQAKDLFEPLTHIKYKNSETMIYQGDYLMGVESYLRGDYESASTVLNSIAFFKDSQLLLREITYKDGISKLSEGYAAAYPYIYASINYKDANRMLNDPSMVLYGNWNVVSQGFNTITDSSLSFNLKNELVINSGNLTLLQDGQYKFNQENGTYVIGDTVLAVEVQDRQNITLNIQRLDEKTSYVLVKDSELAEVASIHKNEGVSSEIQARIDDILNNPITLKEREGE